MNNPSLRRMPDKSARALNAAGWPEGGAKRVIPAILILTYGRLASIVFIP
jgi:hypothetical protein